MAKTKRRQLAALVAKAELKDLASCDERITSSPKSGASGISSLLKDPKVEIRTQRIIFKIPALPSKPPADPPRCQETMPKPVLGKRRRNVQTDIDLSSEQVPADEAKISKVILRFGKWKRKKRVGDLLFTVAKSTASPRLSNGENQQPVGQLLGSDRHLNGHAHLSVTKSPGGQPCTRVNLKRGSRKRVNLQEVLVRSPAEKPCELLDIRDSHDEAAQQPLHRTTEHLVTSNCGGRDLGLTNANKSQELAKICNGDAVRSQGSRKRRPEDIRRVITEVPVINRPAAVLHQESREETSDYEAVAAKGFEKMQSEKMVTKQRKKFGNTSMEDTVLVRSVAARGAVLSTRDKNQANHQNAQILTSPLVKETELLTHVGQTVCSHGLIENASQTTHGTSSQGEVREEVKPELQMDDPHMSIPSSMRDMGVFLVIAKQEIDEMDQYANCPGGKGTVLREADLIKQQNQLAVTKKRLEATGGLRKWLISKGLEQVVPFLEKWKIDDISLLQLTMGRLKMMGLHPVGPRRKLIHAISSLTQPSFRKILF